MAGKRKHGRCRRCGGKQVEVLVPARGEVLPVALLLTGGMLTFYLVGFPLIAAGAWLWHRKRPVLRCVSCGARQD